MNLYSPYIEFNRKEWAELKEHQTTLPLTEAELEQLKGLNEEVSIQEVEDIYLPLTHFIDLYARVSRELNRLTASFMKKEALPTPYIIGIGGSVAVGKSTAARLLQALLARGKNSPKVDLVTTDGFLYPNAVLQEKGIMNRKGFPESYDIKSLIQFMGDVKSGKPEVKAPVYSHLAYDVIQGDEKQICQPDILIIEGINVLQIKKETPLLVSDFFDFSIYIDAEEEHIRHWYVERFKLLRNTAFQNTDSFFHQRFANIDEEETVRTANQIWQDINAKNLHENILPTKGRARLILKKEADHSIGQIQLRKL
ncbi:type I pantothenate kinase [Paenibacillus amylolyticus]|uniref:type I pantothenate kinase n=1 Tax=Paenibacillus amylolyticus TaxID=1451 RepID=UPI003241CB08